MVPYILGIDPGLHGGIAIINIALKSLYTCPTPVIKPTKKQKKFKYDIPAMARLLNDFPGEPGHVIAVGLEQVNAMPGQGTVSMFNFGRGLGIWEGIIAAHRYPVRMILPRVWKAHYEIGADKELARAKASELFPECVHQWKLKKHDGLAEAALIAAYISLEHGYVLDKVIPSSHGCARLF